VQLAIRDSEQPIDTDVDAFIQLQLLLEFVASHPERGLRLRRQLFLEVLDVLLDCG
jgi:hypothetical protein